MHIGLASEQFPPFPLGGLGARVTDLARGLIREGHAVSVVGVCHRNRNVVRLIDETIDGIHVVRIPQSPGWMRWRPGAFWDRYQLSAHFRRLHRKTPFDLVEFTDGLGRSFFGGPPGVPMAIRIDGTARLFDHQMGVDGDRFIYWMEKSALKRAHFLSAVSHYAKRETLKLFEMPGREVTVIHNAVDVDLFSPGIDLPEPGLIVFVNSIEPRKGVEELLVAMNDVCRDYPHARLVLIGSDTLPRVNGQSYSERVLDQVQPQYRDRITFAGQLDRHTSVLSYLRKAHVCCYPSRIETFGVAPLEAMAVGKPVIFGNAGPAPEVVENGVSGLLCDVNSPAALAGAIKRIFDDPSLAQSLASGARARAVAMFNTRGWIRRNLEYYQTCIEAFRSRRAARH